MKNYWYAVLMDAEDNDWGYGSHNLREAKKMARQYEDGRIAVINDGDDPICELVLEKEDFWMGATEIDHAITHRGA